jgi:hypothetical protein
MNENKAAQTLQESQQQKGIRPNLLYSLRTEDIKLMIVPMIIILGRPDKLDNGSSTRISK